MKLLYDKSGAAYTLDHEHDGIAYARPMLKVLLQIEGYEGKITEDEDYEPAEYLISINRSELFDAPPVEVVDNDLATKKAELDALKSEANKVTHDLNSERSVVENRLKDAKRQLDEWMNKHRVMIDLGKLLDGKVLYPLSVKENPYHHSREIPYIPQTDRLDVIVIQSGNLNNGQPWQLKKQRADHYGKNFQFFDTEEERDAVIRSEFGKACADFRKKPDFNTTSHTTGTKLHYGTLEKWIETHPSLGIPKDIEVMKTASDAQLVNERKAKLAAELAALGE